MKTHSYGDHILIESNTPIALTPEYSNGVFKAHDENDAAVKCRVQATFPSRYSGTTIPKLTISAGGTDIIQKL